MDSLGKRRPIAARRKLGRARSAARRRRPAAASVPRAEACASFWAPIVYDFRTSGVDESMKSRWNEQQAKQYVGDLALRVYTSRLLGAEPSLVLHGGGNTSVKTTVANLFGEEESVIYVKGSGWDLETIEAAGFAPCRMDKLLRLST